jgi:hypothetical protein
MMHLTSAQTAARSKSSDDAHGHLDEADRIAQRVGERNALRRHFGPTNIAAWRLAVGIELSEGARAYADATSLPINVQALGSNERTAALHLDFSRALAQEDGQRDRNAIRHLDAADRIAPQLIRPDPIARDLLTPWIGGPRAECGSWTACVTASVSAGGLTECEELARSSSHYLPGERSRAIT